MSAENNNPSGKPFPKWLNYLLGVLIAALALYLVQKIIKPDSTLFYYLCLIVAAFASSFALFSIQKSSASYKSKTKYGDLKLGGPVVVFFLVIIGGYYLPEKNNFDLTLNVYDASSHNALTTGFIFLNIDNEKKRGFIKEDGQAEFKNIAREWRGRQVTLEPAIQHYPASPFKINLPEKDKSLDVFLSRIPDSVFIRGTLFNKSGKPVENAQLNFMSGTSITESDKSGNYSTVLPVAEGSVIGIVIKKENVVIYNEKVKVGSGTEINFYTNNTD